MHVRVYFRRACKVFDILIEALRHQRHPFDMPSSNDAPRKYGSRRFKALYWFHACYYMRARMLSEQGLRGLAQLFAEHREMFDPYIARHLTPGAITRRLQDYGLGFKAEEIGRTWVINAQRLHQRYGGNPIRIFHGVATYEQVCERTCNDFRGHGFYGFQEKVTSLLIIFLIDAGLIEPFMFPAPTDIHAMRVLMIHGILVPADRQQPIYNKKLLPPMRKLFVRYCQYRQVTANELNQVLYMLSRTQCEQHPGNIVRIIGVKNGRQMVFQPNDFTWDDRSRERYAETCGRCPVEKTCQWCMPTLYCYITGHVLANRKRQKPPELSF